MHHLTGYKAELKAQVFSLVHNQSLSFNKKTLLLKYSISIVISNFHTIMPLGLLKNTPLVFMLYKPLQIQTLKTFKKKVFEVIYQFPHHRFPLITNKDYRMSVDAKNSNIAKSVL